MEKTLKKRIGTAMLGIGLFLAVCTADGSKCEMGLRLAGVVMFAIGAYLAEAYDWQNAVADARQGETKEEARLARREEHEPYPEE